MGRDSQLRMLGEAFANVVAERSCGLFTILGMAGVGKSRLTAEFLRGVEARVVTGTCLSYGQGITYWPVVSMVKQLLDPEHGCPGAAGLMAATPRWLPRSMCCSVSRRGDVAGRDRVGGAQAASRAPPSSRLSWPCSMICTGVSRRCWI